MANPFVIAAALRRQVEITCPFCKHRKLVERTPVHHRVCPRCKKQFPDPISHKARKK